MNNISMGEQEAAFKQIKNWKAARIDEIKTELLKYGKWSVGLCFLSLINEYWWHYVIPVLWAIVEIVVPLFKKIY